MSSRKPPTSKGPSANDPSISGPFHHNVQLPPLASSVPMASPASSANQLASNTHGIYQHDASPPDPSIPRHLPSISTASNRRPGITVADIINPDSPSSPTGNASTTSSSVLSPAPGAMGVPWSTSNMVIGSPARTRLEYAGLTRTTSRQHELSMSGDSSSLSFSNQVLPAQSTSFNTVSLAEGDLSERDRARMRLRIRQQPQAARACGLGERDRRVIDPPPILQLLLEGYNPSSASDKNILKSPFNLVSCNLISVDDNSSHQPGHDVTMVSDPNDPSKEMRRLMGQLMISPFMTDDLHANHDTTEEHGVGIYYIFSDLSCRQIGRYKLRFTLLPFDVAAIPVGGRTSTAAVVESDEFTVYSAKDFPGMQPSSELTKRLKNLGASVPIKKGNESRQKKGVKKRTSDSDGSDNDA